MSQRLLHTIRLAGPWEFQVGEGAGEWRSIKLPSSWRAIEETLSVADGATCEPALFRGAKGDLVARRRFQRPTGLDGGERVWIVILVKDPVVVGVRINDAADSLELIPHPQGVACDVTDALRQTNVVTVEFDIDRMISDDGGSPVFAGALVEIRAADDGTT